MLCEVVDLLEMLGLLEVLVLLRPSPLFSRLLSNTFPDFGSVGRKRKKKRPKKHGQVVWN